LKEIIFLGTGTSSQLPLVPCLTAEPRTCAVCLSVARSPDSKNRRRNTSLAVRFVDPTGTTRNVIIDCGKSFYDSALAFFPQHGIATVDGVILTHGHADAMMGLDDLRMWANADDKSSRLAVHLDARTLAVVTSVFPYIVNSGSSTGGGGVPAVDFKLIDKDTPFEVHGLKFTPLEGM